MVICKHLHRALRSAVDIAVGSIFTSNFHGHSLCAQLKRNPSAGFSFFPMLCTEVTPIVKQGNSSGIIMELRVVLPAEAGRKVV
jgi:hypothetical protein